MKIVTLTLSPALDIEYHAERAPLTGMIRTREHRVSAGGKGINVSRSILSCMKRSGGDGIELKTVAPVGGETGRMLARLLEDEGLALTGIEIQNPTRVNVSLIPDGGEPLEINAPGAPVAGGLAEIERTVLDGIGPGDVVVIAGSCPPDVEKSYPSALVGKARKKGAFTVLDCDGEALKAAVRAPKGERPHLIKPNRQEICELSGLGNDADEKAIREAAEGLGIDMVIVTRGGGKSSLTCSSFAAPDADGPGTVYFATEKQPLVRLKGAGDTFLGAFVYAYYGLGECPEWAMERASYMAERYVAGE